MQRYLLSLVALIVGLVLTNAESSAAVTARLVAGTTCTGASSATYTPGTGTQDVTVCVDTTTEFVCGSTLQFVSAGAAEAGRFNITARTVSPSFPDIAQGFTNPTPITEVSSGDLGSNIVTGGSAVSPGSNIVLGTFTIAPQSTATNASYVVSLGTGAVIATATSASGCGLADVPPIAASFTFTKLLPATNVTFTRNPVSLNFAEGGAAQTVAVSCTGTIGTPSPVTMTVASSNTAAFTVSPGTLSFTDCSAPQNVTVTPRAADSTSNPTQTGNVTFTNATSGGTVTAPASVAVTVTDNQAPAVYTVTKSTATVTENNPATDTLTVTCTGAFVSPATSGSVAYSIATLTNPGDIATPPLTGTLNFAACGGATQSITVTARSNDNVVQGTRSGTVTFSGAAGGTLSGSTTGTITVNDDDADPVFTLAQVGACAEPSTNCAFGIVRQSGVVAPRTVTFTVGGTATRGTDYDLKVGTDCATGTLVPVGTNSINHTIAGGQTLNVCVIDDNIVETGGETVILTLTTAGSTAVSAYTLGSPSAGTFTIADDDVAINAVAGNTGSATSAGIVEGGIARFSVSCPTLTSAFTVNYSITPAVPATGDAFVGGGATGSVTCPVGAAGLVAVPTTVQTLDDTVIGNTRTYTMTISVPTAQPAPAATVIGNAVAVVSVADNDRPLVIPTMGAIGLGLMSLMLAGLAAFQRRRRA